MKLVDALARFNRKERYWLIRNALGPTSARLDEAFRDKLKKAIGVDVPVDAWWAMDYHLDWLVGALALVDDESQLDMVRPNTAKLIMGNQEDMDLVVAFKNVLILVEAKGETAWSNEQYRSKVARLEKIRQSRPLQESNPVAMYFVVMSPGSPNGLMPAEGGQWEPWMCNKDGRPMHVELEMPPSLLKVTRWDEGLAKSAAVDTHWKIVPARKLA